MTRPRSWTLTLKEGVAYGAALHTNNPCQVSLTATFSSAAVVLQDEGGIFSGACAAGLPGAPEPAAASSGGGVPVSPAGLPGAPEPAATLIALPAVRIAPGLICFHAAHPKSVALEVTPELAGVGQWQWGGGALLPLPGRAANICWDDDSYGSLQLAATFAAPGATLPRQAVLTVYRCTDGDGDAWCGGHGCEHWFCACDDTAAASGDWCHFHGRTVADCRAEICAVHQCPRPACPPGWCHRHDRWLSECSQWWCHWHDRPLGQCGHDPEPYAAEPGEPEEDDEEPAPGEPVFGATVTGAVTLNSDDDDASGAADGDEFPLGANDNDLAVIWPLGRRDGACCPCPEHQPPAQAVTLVSASPRLAAWSFGLIPDYDRDGVIDATDHTRAATNETFRWWINDDHDVGDTAQDGGSDIPSQTSSPDHADYVVNGRCDLTDFFPVLVNASAPPAGEWEPLFYRLCHADAAVNIIYTSQDDIHAGRHLTHDLTGCGPALNAPLRQATVTPVHANGSLFPGVFTIRLHVNGGRCVILVEGAGSSSAPLVLEALDADGTVIASASLPLLIRPVEQMYTRANLRDGAAVTTPGAALPPPNGKSADKYFMFNAAVPAEAYDPSQWNDSPATGNLMTHYQWRDYTNRSWCAKWHEYFKGNPADDRGTLTWKGRLTAVLEATELYNYYSSGDEVLESFAGTPTSVEGARFWDNSTWGRYAWHKQETHKGRGTLDPAGTSWAGWEFGNPMYEHWEIDPSTGFWRLVFRSYYPTAAAVNAAPLAQLRDIPVFKAYPAVMFGSSIATESQNALLARGIPALSPVTGGISINIPSQGAETRDLDMHTIDRPNSWGRNHSDFTVRWLHGDLKDMAYYFNFTLFKNVVLQGGLK